MVHIWGGGRVVCGPFERAYVCCPDSSLWKLSLLVSILRDYYRTSPVPSGLFLSWLSEHDCFVREPWKAA